MRKRNVVLTGLPRSGTSLTCSLLNKAPNTVALNAPITPGRFAHLLPDLDAVADGIEQYFRRTRRRIRNHGVAISKHTGGQIVDNAYGRPDAEGRRKSVLEKGKIEVEKELDDRFVLVIKQPGLFTATLPQLAARLPCYALVRNPLSVLASRGSKGLPTRHSVDLGPTAREDEQVLKSRMAAHSGPVAQIFDQQLRRRMAAIRPNTVDWQLEMMSWACEHFASELPEQNVIRYEDIVDSGGRALAVISPAAEQLDEPLSSRNLSELYDRDTMLRLGERLLGSDGAYWHFYSREEVEELLGQLS
jgi:hypothetical protein